jgi:hypothetical protein
MPAYTAYASTATTGECNGTTCPAGTIPVAANGLLADVTLQNVRNGSYPAWSFLRLVCEGSTTGNGCTSSVSLIGYAQNFVTFGGSSPNPDFVPVSSTTTANNTFVVRSHFQPPAIGNPCATVSNGTPGVNANNLSGNGNAAESEECGGDVGGVVYTQVADADFANDIQTILTGLTGNRR